MGRAMLGALQVFIGVGGVVGGYSFITDPSGAGLGMTTESLAASPFSDYLIPGIVLLIVNGLGQLVGGLFTLMRWRRAGVVAMGLGGLLVLWVLAQVLWLGLSSGLQTSFLALGLLEVLQGYLLRHSDAQAESS